MLRFARRGLRGRPHASTIRSLQRELRTGLIDSLIDALPDLQGRSGVDLLGSRIVSAIDGTWPLDWLDGATFGRYLAGRIDTGIDPMEALAEVWLADLYLACAVTRGIPAALAAFDRMLVADLPPAIRTIDANADTIDEVLQQLREKLLVPAQGQPVLRLESYSGHGPLGAWLRVSALRTALTLKRRHQPEVAPDDELEAILDLAPNAEVKVLAHQLGGDLRVALRAAVAAQPARIRAVMRLYYGDGRGVEDIGRVYKVHASTVSRWLAKARTDILDQTRNELVSRLGTPPSQVDSLLGHAASLEISLESLLRE